MDGAIKIEFSRRGFFGKDRKEGKRKVKLTTAISERRKNELEKF